MVVCRVVTWDVHRCRLNLYREWIMEFMALWLSLCGGEYSLPVRKGHVERMRESADDESGQFEGKQWRLLRKDAPANQKV